MKKKMIYIVSIIILILIGLVIGFIIVNKKNFLFRADNYKVYNEKGEALPILIFNRCVVHEYGRQDSAIIKEILLYPDVSTLIENVNTEDDVLSINISSADLYGVNGGKNRFAQLGNRYLFQYDLYFSDEFWPLHNNGLIYENKEDEPIKFFIAEGNTYKFNTFGGLKTYGDTVIVEKLDGPIEKEGKYIAGE